MEEKLSKEDLLREIGILEIKSKQLNSFIADPKFSDNARNTMKSKNEKCLEDLRALNKQLTVYIMSDDYLDPKGTKYSDDSDNFMDIEDTEYRSEIDSFSHKEASDALKILYPDGLED